MEADLFFDPERAETTKPLSPTWVRMRVLITVKAAPQPSAAHGETVCIAGLRLDLDHTGWVRLYPINFRDLDSNHQFAKYQVVHLNARPAPRDPRIESWRPDLTSIQPQEILAPWTPRRSYVDPYIVNSMCNVLSDVRVHPPARSLAVVRPRTVDDVEVLPHPGWTADEQRKLDAYANQLDLAGSERRKALEAPTFKGWYRYRCHEEGCQGHRQGILDWEFVALQRNLRDLSPAQAIARLREKFLYNLCGPERDVAFYVGNQAKRPHVFSVVGVYYPRRRSGRP